jgi:hypothetical protein
MRTIGAESASARSVTERDVERMYVGTRMHASGIGRRIANHEPDFVRTFV